MHEPETSQEWVSVRQAAIHYGTSESDIRRRIKRGELESESLSRPGGTLLRIRIAAPESSQHTPESSQHTPEVSQEIAAGLLERLTSQDATISRERRGDRQNQR